MRAVILLALCLAGCGTFQPESTDTYAVCKTADVATTAYALHTGRFVEMNPIIRALIGHGFIPLVLVAYGTWWLLEKLNEPKVTVAANVVTCGVAIHNVALLAK